MGEEAGKDQLGPDQMLWIVFMRCAFLSSHELAKSRFTNMAKKLQDEYEKTHNGVKLALDGDGEIKEICNRITFQRERVLQIVEDRYVCQIQSFLPRAPSAVVGTREPPPQSSPTQASIARRQPQAPPPRPCPDTAAAEGVADSGQPVKPKRSLHATVTS